MLGRLPIWVHHRVPNQFADLVFLSSLSPPQNDTLMQYLLDELHSYKEDFSDALAPTSREASASFAGEAALIRPASTEALQMVHAALTSDVAALHKSIVYMSASQDALAEDMRLISIRKNWFAI